MSKSFSFLTILVASANETLRRPDDDVQVIVQGPEASRIAKKRAAKKQEEQKEPDATKKMS